MVTLLQKTKAADAAFVLKLWIQIYAFKEAMSITKR